MTSRTFSEEVAQWLIDRGIDLETAEAMGWHAHPGKDNVLVTLYYMRGRVVNIKFRSIDTKKFWQQERPKRCFWNFDALSDPTLIDQPIVITEGEMDAMSALQVGYRRAVSVPDGAPDHEIDFKDEGSKYDFLVDAYHDLTQAKCVILAVDNDPPGDCLFSDIVRRIGRGNVKFVRYPRGCKDLNDVLVAYGPEAVKKVLDTAQWAEVDDLRRMSELPPLPNRPAFTGLPWLEKHYRLRFGDLCVITGIPGQGKTTLVNDLMCEVAHKYGWPIGVISPEQEPQTDGRDAMLRWSLGCPPREARPSEIEEALSWIDRHFVFAVPKTGTVANLDWVIDRMKAAVLRFGVRVFVVDPWNELDHGTNQENAHHYIGTALRNLKRAARTLDVHLIIVAHPRKLQATKLIKNMPPPSLYDISDSAHWYNKCDVGIIVHKNTVIVEKSRYRDKIGSPGEVKVEFNPYTGRFQQLPD